MKKISFVIAMEDEASDLIGRLGLKRFTPGGFYEDLSLKFFRGAYAGKLDLTITIPGKDSRFNVDAIGTEPAAVAAFATIREFRPQLLINAGTAGSFQKKGAVVGKVYLSKSEFFYHDHRIPIAGWDKFGRGGFPSYDTGSMAFALGLEQGNVSSGNSLDFTQEDLRRIEDSGAILKEMEAGSIAWVAFMTKTPFFAIKSVTNLLDVNPDSPEEFRKNFGVAARTLTEKTMSVVEYLSRERT